MLPQDLTRDLKGRLNMLAGQLQGIVKMLDSEVGSEKILVQFRAVDGAFDSAHELLLDEVVRKDLALQLVEVLNACPGDCQDAYRIEQLRRLFPALTQDELTLKIRELKEICGRLEEHNAATGKKVRGSP